jgi:hypothetical protein
VAALPWLVVHGAQVWVGALAASPVLGAALDLLRHLRRHRRRLAAAARALGPARPVTQLDDGVRVTLAGRLVVPAPMTGRRAAITLHRVGPGGLAPITGAVEGGLALDAGGQPIALAGDIRVMGGSSETTPDWFRRQPRTEREAIAAEQPEIAGAIAAEDPVVLIASIEDGDRVLAGGVARRIPSTDGGGGYRRPATTWQLVMEEAREGHGLVCTSRPRLARDAWKTALAGAGGALAVVALVFWLGGVLAYRLGAYDLAAATPVRRAEALAAIAAQLEQRPHHDADRLEQEDVAIARLRGSASGEQRALRRHRQLRRAAAMGTRGASPALLLGAARAYEELGEMGLASDALVAAHADRGDLREAVVHLLGGRDDRAVSVLRHVASIGEGSSPYRGWQARIASLLADAIDARASLDPAALARIRRAAERSEVDRAARLLLADLLGGPERAELLRQGFGGSGPPGGVAMGIARLLAREIDTAPRYMDARLVYPVWLAFGREEGQLWSFFPGLFLRDDALQDDQQARTEAAFAASAIGDHARAQAIVAAGALSDETEVIERRSRAADPMPDAHGVWLAQPIAAWLRASAGDGEALAAVLDANPADADHTYAVAGGVKTGREALSAWLRYGVFEHRSHTRLGRLAELEDLRLAAVALGDTEAAADLGAMVERHRHAILRREILVPLAILEEIAGPPNDG